MKSGDVFEIASVIKSLLKRESTKNLSSSEKKMLGTSMQILVSELAVASNKKDEELKKLIAKIV
jgi:CarD family transcriptional regulator